MYPSPQKSYMGIYVKNQFDKLTEIMPESIINIFHMQRRITKITGSLVKYAKAFLNFTPLYFKSYNVVHVHFFYPMILLGFAYKTLRPKTKLVVTFHGTDLRKHIQSKLNIKVYGKILKSADFVIAVGKELATELETKLQRKADAILSAGVDEKVFYNLPYTEKIYDFLFVGTFIKTKGIDIYIDAIKTLGDNNLKFCFVGSGEYKSEISKITNCDADIFENLDQNQIRLLYNQSRFLIVPSRNEAFGLVVTEAMFCGLPVIVSGAGGLKDQVSNNYNGFILEQNDVKHLSEAIIKTNSLSNFDYDRIKANALQSNKIHHQGTHFNSGNS